MSDPVERLRSALSDRYAIESELGRGGMATVYLAHDLKHDRKVAIKVLRPELAATLGAERFLREIRIAAGLNHPHILAVFDSGEADGFLFYVMPYVEGESLRDRLNRERQLPIEAALGITGEVAAALAYAHDQKLVHRDIKPENIMLSATGAVVADFGIARAVTDAGGERLTETGMAVGTPAYMSPEQATGEQVDARSDIYSLGCVLYEMLGGEPPYLGTTPQSILARKLTDPVPSLRAVRQVVSGELEAMVVKSLAREPVDRYQTAAELAAALVAPPGSAALFPASRLRNRLLSTRALLVLVPLVLVGTGWWLLRGGAISGSGRQHTIAVLPCINMSRDSAQEYMSDRWTEELIGRLSKVSAFGVKPWATSRRYKGSSGDTRQIARELSASNLVFCGVHQTEDSLLLEVQLVESDEDEIVWSEEYAQVLTARSIGTTQGDVVRQIVATLGVDLPTDERARLEVLPTRDLEALEFYRRGRQLFEMHNTETLPLSIEYYDRAIALDSTFALAYAAKAMATLTQGEGEANTAEVMPRVGRLALEALELDGQLAEAHAVRGEYLLFYQWDWPAAELHFRNAVRFDPISIDVRRLYGNALMVVGRHDEGIAQLEHMVELDPMDPFSRAILAHVLWWAGHNDRAVDEVRIALELNPSDPFALVIFSYTHWERGNLDSAVALAERAVQLYGFDLPKAILGYYYGLSNRHDDAQDMLDEFLAAETTRYVDPELPALLMMGMGRRQEALDYLERSLEDRSWSVLWDVGGWPLFEALHDEPRFQAMRERVGFDRW